jgi:nitronate monooxygenase
MKNFETFKQLLNVDFPIIMAPMFLVSNEKMVVEALKAGISACFPALNYRTIDEFKNTIISIKKQTDKPFGVNLIVNKSNIKYKEQLQACVDLEVNFIITSLGSPEETIKACKPKGIKVFCDVVDLDYALKVEKLGADAIIAVNNKAGGHAGPMNPEELIPLLKKHCTIPIISAGGVGEGKHLNKVFELGACGASVGSIFIASNEAPVSQEYKQAIVDYKAKDIILTEKLSGSPCTVINTPYVKEIGTRRNWIENLLSKNKTLKKYVKMLTFYNGMKALEKAAFSTTYNTVWCAGPSIEYVYNIRSISEIVDDLKKDYYANCK